MGWLETQVLSWFDKHGRKDLPWQKNRTPYRVWVSEIMLQQTQVITATPYFQKFIQQFPTNRDLSKATLDEVLHLWTGLGYYSRARNLHRASKLIEKQHQGEFPTTIESLIALPGIGRTTAGAILSLSHDLPFAILDANVKRVLARFYAIEGYPGTAAVSKILWKKAQEHTPNTRTADYTQAIMDLGATVCQRNPLCQKCPLLKKCEAGSTGTFHLYPGKKMQRPKRTRAVRMFIIQNQQGDYLLQKRPKKGIWAELWTPPERSSNYSPKQMVSELNTASPIQYCQIVGPKLVHAFSHYDLHIEPIYLNVSCLPKISQASEWLWYNKEEDKPVGLPAPALKLMNIRNL